MGEKDERIKKIVKLYYTKPEVQEALTEFGREREVVPKYYEQFGKRPDVIQYPSDIGEFARKGATSFHASEEIWCDPMRLHSEMSRGEMDSLRKGWDLLIDIDSPFLDCSKIAAKLLIAALEHYEIGNYGIKFSGNKGFHIIVSGAAFPESYDENLKKNMFPEWPRIICTYLMDYIKKDYNKLAADILTDYGAIKERMNLGKEELEEVYCTLTNSPAKKGSIIQFICPVCGLSIERKDIGLTKKRLKCLNSDCAGVLEVGEKKEYYFSLEIKDPENENFFLSSDKYPEYFKKVEGVSAERVAGLDLVLVAPRHLFRMPYSLHEKTALASIVIGKNEISDFNPKNADPLKVRVKKFMPDNRIDEGKELLIAALNWNKNKVKEEEKREGKSRKDYKEINFSGVNEKMFPKPIKKLMQGVKEGRKRGLFILITFLRFLNFPNEYVEAKVKEWNKKNENPLKEGYVKSQLDWHFRQKKKILPPNYENAGFYKDLGIIEEMPKDKNPIVEVMKKMWSEKKSKEDGE